MPSRKKVKQYAETHEKHGNIIELSGKLVV